MCGEPPGLCPEPLSRTHPIRSTQDSAVQKNHTMYFIAGKMHDFFGINSAFLTGHVYLPSLTGCCVLIKVWSMLVSTRHWSNVISTDMYKLLISWKAHLLVREGQYLSMELQNHTPPLSLGCKWFAAVSLDRLSWSLRDAYFPDESLCSIDVHNRRLMDWGLYLLCRCGFRKDSVGQTFQTSKYVNFRKGRVVTFTRSFWPKHRVQWMVKWLRNVSLIPGSKRVKTKA